jgi:hypothetical protein
MRTIKLLSLLGIMLIATAACNKYDNGPSVSFRSKKARVVGKWNTERWMIDKYYLSTDQDTDRRAEFTDIGVYYYHERNPITHAVIDLKGTWDFRQNKEQLILGLPDGTNSAMNYQLWDIKRLKNKELWLEMVDYGFPNSVLYEWRLKPE